MMSALDSKASFELATFFVTWAALALLGLLVTQLHVRLQQVERAGRAPTPRPAPYGHLIGTHVRDFLDGAAGAEAPRLVLFLSSECQSCRRLVGELQSPSWTGSAAIAWIDHAPTPPPPLPPTVVVLQDGAKVGAALGIRVTPFVVEANADGRVVKASPIHTLNGMGAAARP